MLNLSSPHALAVKAVSYAAGYSLGTTRIIAGVPCGMGVRTDNRSGDMREFTIERLHFSRGLGFDLRIDGISALIVNIHAVDSFHPKPEYCVRICEAGDSTLLLAVHALYRGVRAESSYPAMVRKMRRFCRAWVNA
jgi:hypothetical protein